MNETLDSSRYSEEDPSLHGDTSPPPKVIILVLYSTLCLYFAGVSLIDCTLFESYLSLVDT